MAEKILILHQRVKSGAGGDEQDTIIQAQFIADAMRDAGVRPYVLTIDLNLSRAERRLRAIRPDIVFYLVESLEGKGSFIHFAAGLLESLGIPFTGSSARALFSTSHKLLSKELMRKAGLPTPDWFVAGKDPFFPCIRKSVWEHASLGMGDDAVLLEETAFHDRRPAAHAGFFFERFVDGREFNIVLLEINGRPQVLPPVEISFVDYPAGKPKIVGYQAKWENDSFEFINTVHRVDFPDSDRPLLAVLSDLAVACWDLFGLSGYARVDFRVDGEGKPWVLEINANPCLTPDAGFYKTALLAGFSRATLMTAILDAARRAQCKE